MESYCMGFLGLLVAAYRNSCNYVNTALKEAKVSYNHRKLSEITIPKDIYRI